MCLYIVDRSKELQTYSIIVYYQALLEVVLSPQEISRSLVLPASSFGVVGRQNLMTSSTIKRIAEIGLKPRQLSDSFFVLTLTHLRVFIVSYCFVPEICR